MPTVSISRDHVVLDLGRTYPQEEFEVICFELGEHPRGEPWRDGARQQVALEVERAEAWEREHDGRGGTVVAQRQDLQVLELGEHAVGIARRSASSLASSWRM